MQVKSTRQISYCLNSGKILLCLFFTIAISSCKKYLEEKPDKKIATPSSLDDLDGMLDHYFNLNARYPSAGEVSADNYYLTDAGWAATLELNRNYYIWQKYDDIRTDWSAPYNNIFYADVILGTLGDMDISANEQSRVARIRGSAFFIRAYYHYALAQLFAQPYDKITSGKDLGIPLRLNMEYKEPAVRSSVEQTYGSILSDLKQAISLLPEKPVLKYRPSKPAAYGAVARTYLVMGDYENAGLYADSCLKLYDSLMDYSTLTATASIPFKQFNAEVIYDARTSAPSALAATRAKTDTMLFNSYMNNDIRKTIFFKSNTDGSKAFKGNYTGLSTASLFAGIATDEMYLIRAESAARSGNIIAAMKDLNDLLRTRWKKVNGTTTYVDQVVGSGDEALQIILRERRKQLLYRTLRWSDMRRLNKESRFAITIYRTINGQRYELVPGSPRYTLLIPKETIALSGIAQNP